MFLLKFKSDNEFSNYLYDPNKNRVKRAVRVITIIKKVINLCRKKVEKTIGNLVDKKEFVLVTDKEFQEASNYYFWKATLEVKEFCKKEVYEKITFEKDEILIHKCVCLLTSKLPHQSWYKIEV